MRARNRIINGLATAIVAVFFTQVLHETVHLISAWIVGAPVNAFNLFAVDIILYSNPQYVWHDIIIEAGASIMNVIVGVIALILFHYLKKASTVSKQFLLQLTSYSFLMGFGYFLFDSLFYTPETPGDWKSVLNMLDGNIMLRIALIIIGTGGMLFTFFWLAKNVLIFTEDNNSKKCRIEAASPILLIPYVGLGIMYIFLSIWHPLGLPLGLIIVFFQFVFGFSGLFWGYMLAVYWLKPDNRDSRNVQYTNKLSLPWISAAIIVLIIQIAVLLPTIDLA